MGGCASSIVRRGEHEELSVLQIYQAYSPAAGHDL